MAESAFKKGAALGAASVLLLETLVAVLAVWILALTGEDDPPAPTAEMLDAAGTVTSTAPTLCVEGARAANHPRPQTWCGLVQPGSSAHGLTVGDAVTGTIVGVETDPGSGWAFGVWESVTSTE